MPLEHDFRGNSPSVLNAIRNKVKNYTSFITNKQLLVFQRRLGDAAKKAISKLQVRTIKKGDKVTASFLFSEELFVDALG